MEWVVPCGSSLGGHQSPLVWPQGVQGTSSHPVHPLPSVDPCPRIQGSVLVGSQPSPHLTGEGSPPSWGAETWARMFTTPEVTVGRDGAVPGEQDGQGADGEGPSQVLWAVSVSP